MQVKKSHYRLRVFKDADGVTQLVFGNDAVTDVSWTLLADHDVTETVEVVDHVEPAAN